ncbi:MAG TPA: BTAD domain-containing putative transcriptional regulator [Gemmatimonadaceae bacterium]|nr:BTAD domain-containing putative transcriptional regulator [Gemmatimonadaceae bacterium]
MGVIRLRLLGGVELSTHEDDREHRISVAPKPLALLAYLAVAAAEQTPVRRDVLVGLFWPELPTDRARAALRQLLFQLRRTVGESVFQVGRETVALVPDALTSDVTIFEQRLARADRAGAMEVYRGTLLDGFFVDGMSAAFEEWLGSARARLTAKAFAACTALADDAERGANGIAAAQWARAAAALAPDDEIALRRLVQTLNKFGDRCGALRAADDFARRLALEFDATPAAETQALVAAIRARRTAPIRESAVSSTSTQAVDVAPAAANVERAPIVARSVEPRTGVKGRVGRVLARGGVAATVALGMIVVALVLTRRGGAVPGPGLPVHAMAPPITIQSAAARGLYDLGVARYEAGDAREADRLLVAALATDSNCAMCAYYAAMANSTIDDGASEQMLERANRLASRVSEPERLLIQYRWADATNNFVRRAIADSLVARYPQWPEAQAAAAEAADMDGAWLVAADHLRRAIAAEPLPPPTSNGQCPPCSTRLLLISTYEAADSLAAALRVAQAFVREQPHARLAWLQLSHALASSGRYAEARVAMDSSTRYAGGTEDDVAEHAAIEIRARNFATADRLLATLAQTGNVDKRRDALWGLIISLRAQGRLHDALDVAQGAFRRVNGSQIEHMGLSRAVEGQIDFELGRYRQAASMFESAAAMSDSFTTAAQGRNARQHAWMLTHAGSAVAASGDTVMLAALIDTVRTWGSKSGFARDRRLHDYLTGLLWKARGRPDSAADAFARATLSETDGFSRVNLERARALLALGRPDAAIPVLRNSLAGPLEAGNFYATPTEVEEELARAYEAAGQLDSAAVYYRYVVTAWRGADAQFQPREGRARERMNADEHRAIARHPLAEPALAPR